MSAGRESAPWNKSLIETENFAVIPSLGALVEGWLLMVPKVHYISMGALPVDHRKEADDLEARLIPLLRGRYNKPVVAFEHGPSAVEHGTGCGVDHAHLHLVPLEVDLVSLAAPFIDPNLHWYWGDWQERTDAYQAGLDYLFVKDQISGGHLIVAKDFGSQVFRKAIAAHLSMPAQFSWREYPMLHTLNRTIAGLTAAGASPVDIGAEHVA
jgi:diadenosine tetraphosphate (Ap4A) HIT family hydrolase